MTTLKNVMKTCEYWVGEAAEGDDDNDEENFDEHDIDDEDDDDDDLKESDEDMWVWEAAEGEGQEGGETPIEHCRTWFWFSKIFVSVLTLKTARPDFIFFWNLFFSF